MYGPGNIFLHNHCSYPHSFISQVNEELGLRNMRGAQNSTERFFVRLLRSVHANKQNNHEISSKVVEYPEFSLSRSVLLCLYGLPSLQRPWISEEPYPSHSKCSAHASHSF